jgi:phosphoglucosamine mutase
MLAKDASIGGEESGHIIFLDHHTTGDGIIAAFQLLNAMKYEDKPLSELAGIMKVFPQRLINIDVKSKPDITTVPEIVEVIKEVEEKLGDKGRVLVRYSGTQHMCRVMVEGPSEKDTEIYCRKVADVITQKIG